MPNAQISSPDDITQSCNSESVPEEVTLAVNSLAFAGTLTTVTVSAGERSNELLPEVGKHAGRVRYVSVVPSGQVGDNVGKSVGDCVGGRVGLLVG